MAQKSQNTNVSMEIVESLNPSGLDFIKDFYREFTQLLDKYVQLAEGTSLFKSDKNRRLERTHLITLIKGQELDSYVLKDLNTFNIYRNLNPGPVASTVELYRQLSESQKENMRSHFLKNSLVRDPQVDIDTLREVEKIKKLADSLRQRNKIVNSDKSQRFLQSYTNNGVNLLHQFHITVNQFVDGDDDVAAPPVKEHKRKRRAIRTDDDGNKVEHPSEKRRRLQIHFIRESLWSILGQLGLQRSAFANKLPTTSFDSDNNWAGTVNFEGWPKETTNRRPLWTQFKITLSTGG
ncbi:hypothetical protein [Parasitella parasitica]|uniref:Uncharacterized protein n=1 Tax=Parasitella parasitica TaxID=35722 RepID=A0A0B7NFL6_9FUNG|nr:hypothetical protein [Parasitella parasitica]